ncbi:biotin-dependent carboxyltransferase family protein [Gluconacetobacter sp. Hr-1-5]|uniref:5-oxoprolinase subunit C family protein n=1 Tax=Gluconacetobacter sp. Hr-1-5 TaxID=3395370 RepID=UPI003B52DCD6
MMPACEILTDGPLNTIQDLGRRGYAAEGVSRAGAMDPLALRLGNALVGNDGGQAALEIAFFPFRVRFLRRVAFAITGAHGAALLDDVVLPPWWGMVGEPGQELTLQAPLRGVWRYLALEGGVDVPLVLGARATDLKGCFGGWRGGAVGTGTRLTTLPAAGPGWGEAGGWGCVLPPDALGPAAGSDTTLTVRVLAAAEYDRFTDAARDAFTGNPWFVSRTCNRVGYRLEGTPLTFETSVSLFSHGIVPGTVQVPPNGLPIVQMVDANTCGGYPKIATVIEPDLRLLAQARPGTAIRFEIVTLEDALAIYERARAIVSGLSRALGAVGPR